MPCGDGADQAGPWTALDGLRSRAAVRALLHAGLPVLGGRCSPRHRERPGCAELAIKAGRGLCKNLLEPLHSDLRPCDDPLRLPERQRERFRQCQCDGMCSQPERTTLATSGTIEDADGHIGATACIVIPWFVDWLREHRDRTIVTGEPSPGSSTTTCRTRRWSSSPRTQPQSHVASGCGGAGKISCRGSSHKVGALLSRRETLTAPVYDELHGARMSITLTFLTSFTLADAWTLPGGAEYGTGLHHLSDACRVKQRENGRFQELLTAESGR